MLTRFTLPAVKQFTAADFSLSLARVQRGYGGGFSARNATLR